MPAMPPPPALAVLVVHAEAGERRQLEQRRAAIEQQRDALARQECWPRARNVAPGVRGLAHLLFERAKLADQRQHLLAIGAKLSDCGSIRLSMIGMKTHSHIGACDPAR